MKNVQIVFISMLVMFSAHGNAAESQLDAEQVKNLFSDSTVEAFSELRQAPVSLYYDQNGEVRGVFSNGKKSATKWWVKDNGHICLKGKDGDLCFLVMADNGSYQKYLVKPDGQTMLAFSMETFTPGNVNQY